MDDAETHFGPDQCYYAPGLLCPLQAQHVYIIGPKVCMGIKMCHGGKKKKKNIYIACNNNYVHLYHFILFYFILFSGELLPDFYLLKTPS